MYKLSFLHKQQISTQHIYIRKANYWDLADTHSLQR